MSAESRAARSKRRTIKRRPLLKYIAAGAGVLTAAVLAAECGSPLVKGVSREFNIAHLKRFGPEIEAMDKAAYENVDVLLAQQPRLLEISSEILYATLGDLYDSNATVITAQTPSEFVEVGEADMPCMRGTIPDIYSGLYLINSGNIVVNAQSQVRTGRSQISILQPASSLLITDTHERLHANPKRESIVDSDYNFFMLQLLRSKRIPTDGLYRKGVIMSFRDPEYPNDPKCSVQYRSPLEEAMVEEASIRFYEYTGLALRQRSGYENMRIAYVDDILRRRGADEMLELQQRSQGRVVVEALGRKMGIKAGANLYSQSDEVIYRILHAASH